MSKKTKHILLTIFLIVIGVSMMGVLTSQKDIIKKEKPLTQAPMVKVKAVKTGDHQVVISSEGTVTPLKEINIVPQVSGKIIYISPAFLNGGEFNKDDILFRIDPEDYEIAVTQAHANVKNSESLYQQATEASEAAVEEWELHKSGMNNQSLSPSDLVLKKPQLVAALAKLEADQANLKKATLNLDRTEIKAPFSGRISEEKIDVGQFVVSGQPVGSIYSIDVAEIVLPFDDNKLSWFNVPGFTPGNQTGSPATIHVRIAGQTMTWDGVVSRAEGKLDERTRMVNIVVRVNDPFSKKPPLAPGLFVTVDIKGNTVSNAALIPRSAIRGRKTIWTVGAENVLKFSPVKVVTYYKNNALIIVELNKNDQIILSGLRGVTDGMRVSPQPNKIED